MKTQIYAAPAVKGLSFRLVIKLSSFESNQQASMALHKWHVESQPLSFSLNRSYTFGYFNINATFIQLVFKYPTTFNKWEMLTLVQHLRRWPAIKTT